MPPKKNLAPICAKIILIICGSKLNSLSPKSKYARGKHDPNDKNQLYGILSIIETAKIKTGNMYKIDKIILFFKLQCLVKIKINTANIV